MTEAVSDDSEFVHIEISRDRRARKFSAGASRTDELKSADTFLDVSGDDISEKMEAHQN